MQIRVITDCPDNGINYGKYQLFRESPKKSVLEVRSRTFAEIRGLKLSAKVRNTRGLFAVNVSPQMPSKSKVCESPQIILSQTFAD